MDEETFKREFNAKYNTDQFLEPWSLLLMRKEKNTVEFQVADYYPKLVQPGEPFPEVEDIPLEELEKHKDAIKDLIHSVDPDVNTIIINKVII
ncbi:hypothetical protein KBH77_02725 [Patescibacteria group bacterium]|nr:hypothetical protein [Patescibacteria group bacterium]HQA87775.1 hypothetical protein [Candidatus Dojkabacteria bacterium]